MIGVAGFFALADRTLGQPPRGVGSQTLLCLQPIASFLLSRWTLLLNKPEPLFERPAGLLLQFADPLYVHGYAGMHAVDRFLCGCSLCHTFLPVKHAPPRVFRAQKPQ